MRLLSIAMLACLFAQTADAQQDTRAGERAGAVAVEDAIDDVGLSQLLTLEKLTELDLSYRLRITDAGLSHVAQLASLRRLNLRACRVTDAGLKHLSALQDLRELDLSRCAAIGDAGLLDLSRLPRLRSLKLMGCRAVSDTGLSQFASSIARFGTLELLDLMGTGVTDAVLEPLAKLPALRTLELSETKVSDAGLKHLAGHASLRELSLAGCFGVTDAGLMTLTALEAVTVGPPQGARDGLGGVSAHGVTLEGIEAFKRAAPGCKVHTVYYRDS